MSAKTVLVIDYEPDSVKATSATLERAGYRVESVRDGIAGLQAFGKLKPDLVIVEAMLPKKHGFEVCQAIKSSPDGARTAVVITTAIYKGRKYRADAFGTYRCDEYLEKPFTEEQLLTICRRLLHEEGVLTPAAVSAAATATAGGPAQAARSASRPLAPSPAPRLMTLPPTDLKDLTEDEIDGRLDALLFDPGDAAAPSGLDLPDRNGPAASPAAAEAVPRAPLPDVDVPETDPLSWEALTNAAAAFEIPDGDWVTGPAIEPEKLDPAPPPANPPLPATARVASPETRPPTEPPKERVSPSVPPPSKSTPVAEAVAHAAAVEPAPSRPRVTRPPEAKPATRSMPRSILVVAALAVAAAVAGAVWLRSGGDRPSEVPPPVASTNVPAVPDLPAPAESAAPVVSEAALETPPAAPVPSPDPVRLTTPPLSSAVPQAPATAKRAEPQPAVVPAPIASAPAVSAAKPPRATPEPAPAPPEQALAEPLEEGVSGADAAPLAPVPEEPAAAKPAPAVAAGDLISLESADTPPIEVSRPGPVYPPFARQMRQQGTVMIRALVDETGAVAEAQVAKGIPGSPLNESALQAVRGWTYRPATKNGVPVKVWITVSVSFRL